MHWSPSRRRIRPVRAEIVALLTAFLDRPSASANGDEEVVTAFIIGDLGDLKALSAYEAIRRAYAEVPRRRTDHRAGGCGARLRGFGRRSISTRHLRRARNRAYGWSSNARCAAETEHIFPKVYYDLGTANDDKKKDKYDPLIIPQRVVCPKCGAVEQYELGTMGHMAVTASLLALRFPDGGSYLREDQRVTFLNFTTRSGAMHPQEAIERYQREVARQPEDISLHVGFGNLYRIRPSRPGRIRVCAGFAPRSRCCRGLARPGAARRSASRYSRGDPLLGEGTSNIPQEWSIACRSNPHGRKR